MGRSELPPSKLGGICGANSHIFVAQIRFAAPKDAACHPTLRFIPAASCRVFSLAFINTVASVRSTYAIIPIARAIIVFHFYLFCSYDEV